MDEDDEDIYYSDNMINNENQEEELLNEYMLSTINSIKEEFLLKYPQETSNFYVYTKYNEKLHLFKIFITLLRNTPINKRDNSINFLITLDKEYPAKPPMVFCLTDVNQNFYIIKKNIVYRKCKYF